MDINQKFEPDRVYQAVAWRSAPWWVIEVEEIGATQAIWWPEVEFMTRDMIACMFELDDPSVIRLELTRGIGPVMRGPSRSPRTWIWAIVAGLKDRRTRRAQEGAAR